MYAGVLSLSGDPDDTYSITGEDTLQGLTAYGIRIKRDDQPAVGVHIAVEEEDMRYRVGDRIASGHLLSTKSDITIMSVPFVERLRIGNATAGNDTVLKVTVVF